MFSTWLLSFVAILYVGILFGIAYWGDRIPRQKVPRTWEAVIYSLSLGVYCTSWTFYGAVGTAASTGWGYLPIYLGPALIFLFAPRFLQRVARICRKRNITSVADFIALRFGKARSVAVMVTVIAVIGAIPYIALQLKAVAMSLSVLADSDELTGPTDLALGIALALALFSILFGTRELDASEHHRGMMWAIALESIVKLLAFLIVGLFAIFGVLGGMDGLEKALAERPDLINLFSVIPLPDDFVVTTLLGAAAIFCLPRQFHVAFVEYKDNPDLDIARWVFPTYLAIFSLLVVPITVAGIITLGDVNPDTFVLALPVSRDQPLISVLVFLGGFSAATGMVIIATVALATMVSNELVLPLILRLSRRASDRDVSGVLLNTRRLAIVVLALSSWAYYRFALESQALASIGLLSFAAAAQFAPSIVLGMYWQTANRTGALAGLVGGFVVWVYTLLLPALFGSDANWVMHGPAGLDWLRPEALLGLEGMSPLSHGLLVSMVVNCTLLVTFSLRHRQSLGERLEAGAFTREPSSLQAPESMSGLVETRVSDLKVLVSRFVGQRQVSLAFDNFFRQAGKEADETAIANRELLQFSEDLLAGSIGAASARDVLSSALQGRGMAHADVALLLTQTSEAARFSRRLLEAALNNISVGVSVVDSNMHLVGWNQAYLDLFDYPGGLIYTGRPVADLIRFNARRGFFGDGEIEENVERRIRRMRTGTPYRYERIREDGRAIEIVGNAMPDGGYITTYTDITDHKRAEQALRASEAQVRLYTDNAPAMLAYVDRDQRIRFANKAYVEFVGGGEQTIIGRHIGEVLPQEEMQKRSPFLELALAGQKQHFELELESPTRGSIYALCTYIPDVDANGTVLGFFGIFQDITGRHMAELLLKEANENLEDRVAQRTRELSQANAALEEAKAQADNANEAKTRFLAAASHDLMQPLHAARLFSSALVQLKSDMSDDQARLAQRIESSLDAAEDLLTGMLDISRLDRGVLQPQFESFSLRSLYRRIEAQFEPLAREAGLRFRVRCPNLFVRSDLQLLHRIIQNFISNAIRYTQRGGILIGARVRGQEVQIEVWDTGPGIAEKDHAEIFVEFNRLDVAARGQRGLGLGLAISARMAEKLGHTILLRSKVGHGSCFSVSVPRAPQQETGSPITSSDQQVATLEGVRILCIDNEPEILEGIQDLLGQWGCEVKVALGENDVRDVLATGFQPRLVLADYHLDGEANGVALVDELSLAESAAIIVVTADRSDELHAAWASRGFISVTKPVRPAKLRAAMARALSLLAGNPAEPATRAGAGNPPTDD